MLFIGSQVIDQSSLLLSLHQAVKMGANVAQVFLRDMSSASPKGRIELSPQEIRAVRLFIQEHQLHVFVHASYLLHFCRHEIGYGGIQWAYQILREDMALAEELGMKGVVLHMCSTKRVPPKGSSHPDTRTIKETQESMVGHIQYFLSTYGQEFPNVTLLLENSAGEHSRIGKNLKELGAVYKPLHRKFPGKVGLCLDTCHAFAAGNHIHTPKGLRSFFTTYQKEVGPLSSLHLIHLNDSAHPFDSKKDRHTGLGQGHLFSNTTGQKTLRELVLFCAKNSIPLCLETHANYKQEIALIRSLFLQKGGSSLPISKILESFQEIQTYHQSLGNKREADQYKKVIASLRDSKIQRVSRGEELLDLPFVGKGTVSKVNELLQTGKIELLESFKKDPIVQAIKNLTSIFDVGPVTAKKWVTHGILSLSDLKKAVKEKKIKLTQGQTVGLKYHHDLITRSSRKEAENIQKQIQTIAHKYDKKAQVILAGSYRTGKQTLGDIDVVIASSKNILRDVINDLIDEGKIIDTLQGESIPRETQDVYMGIWKETKKAKARHVDIHLVDWKTLPFHMLYFGSGERFSRMIRQHAKEQGYRLTHKNLVDLKTKKEIYLPTEEAIFAYLHLPYQTPKKR